MDISQYSARAGESDRAARPNKTPILGSNFRQRRAALLAHPRDHIPCFAAYRHACDTGYARLDNPGLFGGDCPQRVAQQLHMVQSNVGDDCDQGMRDHIGRIQTPA